jgi:hypothetical protein
MKEISAAGLGGLEPPTYGLGKQRRHPALISGKRQIDHAKADNLFL